MSHTLNTPTTTDVVSPIARNFNPVVGSSRPLKTTPTERVLVVKDKVVSASPIRFSILLAEDLLPSTPGWKRLPTEQIIR